MGLTLKNASRIFLNTRKPHKTPPKTYMTHLLMAHVSTWRSILTSSILIQALVAKPTPKSGAKPLRRSEPELGDLEKGTPKPPGTEKGGPLRSLPVALFPAANHFTRFPINTANMNHSKETREMQCPRPPANKRKKNEIRRTLLESPSPSLYFVLLSVFVGFFFGLQNPEAF